MTTPTPRKERDTVDLVIEEAVGGPEGDHRLRRDVLALFGQLGPASRRQRFGGPLPELPALLLDRLSLDADGWSHVVLVARLAGSDTVVGIARLVREEEWSEAAEVAVEVADTYQRRGVGRTLLSEIRRIAAERRITTMTADILATNVGARRLLALAADLPGVLDVREQHLGDGRMRAVLRLAPAPRRTLVRH